MGLELRLRVEARARVVEVDLSRRVEPPVLGCSQLVEALRRAERPGERRRNAAYARVSSARSYVARAGGAGLAAAVVVLAMCQPDAPGRRFLPWAPRSV